MKNAHYEKTTSAFHELVDVPSCYHPPRLLAAHLQIADKEVHIADHQPPWTPLAGHRAEQEGGSEAHSQKHLDTGLELVLQAPPKPALFKAPRHTWKKNTLTSN